MSTSKTKRQVSSPKTDQQRPAGWRERQQQNRQRHLVANLITILMIVLTLLVLAWVAYQLNYPIAIELSRFIHR